MPKAPMQVEFKEWTVPNFATVDHGEGKRNTTIAVEDLPGAALDALAQDWINRLYAKAKQKPPTLSKPSTTFPRGPRDQE
jgi:hypothetical protein